MRLMDRAAASRTACALFAAGMLVFCPLAARADTLPVLALQYSADSGANIIAPNQFAARNDYVSDDLAGTRVRRTIAGLPERANLADFQIDANGDLLFSLDIGTTLGGSYFDPADVIKFSGGVFSKAFDAAVAGVPKGVHCDAIARLDRNGALLLSFDRTFAAGGLTIRPADVMQVNGGVLTAKKLDGQAFGLASSLNIIALDALGTHSDLLVAFDSGGTAGGVPFTRNDLLSVHLPSMRWTKRYSLTEFSDRWGAAHVDGLALGNDTIFKDGFD